MTLATNSPEEMNGEASHHSTSELAWKQFCEVVELGEEALRIVEYEGAATVHNCYLAGSESSDFSFGSSAIPMLQQQVLLGAWRWLDSHPETIIDPNEFITQFTYSSFSQLLLDMKRKRQELEEQPNKRSQRDSEDFNLESKFGTHKVEMKVDALLGYVEGFQRELKVRRRDVLHNKQELSLELLGRKAALDSTVHAFEKRKTAFSQSRRPDDHTCYPIVVYSGMPGLGKTRMLEECERAFAAANIKLDVSVLISYGKERRVRKMEEKMSIEASFGWWLLHRLFVELLL